MRRTEYDGYAPALFPAHPNFLCGMPHTLDFRLDATQLRLGLLSRHSTRSTSRRYGVLHSRRSMYRISPPDPHLPSISTSNPTSTSTAISISIPLSTTTGSLRMTPCAYPARPSCHARMCLFSRRTALIYPFRSVSCVSCHLVSSRRCVPPSVPILVVSLVIPLIPPSSHAHH